MADKNGTIEALSEESIQARFQEDDYVGGFGGILTFLYSASDIISPWWSYQRDIDLLRIVHQSDAFQSAIYKVQSKLQSIELKIMPRDTSIRAHHRLADEYQSRIMEWSDMGQGWHSFWEKWVYDLSTQDNGAFAEIIGEGAKDGPIIGPALALNNLESSRCRRTSNPVYPVLYTDTDGRLYRLHYTRVLYTSQQASSQARMNGVGHCWVSRAVNKAQNLIDISVYQQEKLGSRPARQMLIGQGLSAKQIWSAIMMANRGMDAQGLKRYAKNVVIGDETRTDIDIIVKDLASVPDGFDEETSNRLGMFMIALAGGFPPRDLWPATTTGATKADAQFQHLGGAAGYEVFTKTFSQLIGGSPEGARHSTGKFLPVSLKAVFDVVDDDQDERRAKISETRAKTRDLNLASTVIDIRVAREQALESGDLTRPQFNQLELQSGRLPDGRPIADLFYSRDEAQSSLLSLGIGDALEIERNLAEFGKEFILERISTRLLDAKIALANESRNKERIRQVIATLEWLKAEYEGEDQDQPDESIQVSEMESEGEDESTGDEVQEADDAQVSESV